MTTLIKELASFIVVNSSAEYINDYYKNILIGIE
jgi:hypothetical protein